MEHWGPLVGGTWGPLVTLVGGNWGPLINSWDLGTVSRWDLGTVN